MCEKCTMESDNRCSIGGADCATPLHMRVMTDYERQVIESAEKNHIWLNAFACIRPSDEFLIGIGRQVLDMLEQKENLIYPHQDSEIEAMRSIGKLTPELILRVNKS